MYVLCAAEEVGNLDHTIEEQGFMCSGYITMDKKISF
jgi:hypothetical protein